MLEKPDLEDDVLSACVQHAYGLRVVEITFLPLGADPHTAVYRVIAASMPYFVKLRWGDFAETSVTVPAFLSAHGIAPIIAPRPTQTGQLWTRLGRFTVIVYPFVAGQNGYVAPLSPQHWRDFGAALKALHTTLVPPVFTRALPRETYADHGRMLLTTALSRLDQTPCPDPIARDVVALLTLRRAEILDLLERAGRFAQALQADPPAFVICHADAHAGNILIDGNDRFYIVDWDTLLLAPKERDLMFVGGGQGFIGYRPHDEETLFYQGYGQTAIDFRALAYYRYERIIQDIAISYEQLVLTAAGGADREPSLHYLRSNFLPGGTLERAYAADPTRS